MSSKPSIIRYLEKVASVLPAPIYWLDRDSRLLGANHVFFEAIGALGSIDEWIGKSAYDVYPFELAEIIVKHNEEVMRTGKMSGQEETIRDIDTGTVRYFAAVKSPLYDDNGTVIGLIGTSIETTAQKEAEQREMEAQKRAELLKVENEAQKSLAKEQEKYSTLARKVAHDIKSPLSALKVMISSCSEESEEKRIAMHRATESILDIANNLITNYQIDQPRNGIEAEPRQALLVSDFLTQVVSEKKIEYRDSSILFASDIAENAQFAFIRTQKSEFRRAISNLINNAVDSLKEKKDGKISVRLTATNHAVIVTIEDNGKGMSVQSAQKMGRRDYFTEGKENGHGIGLRQVWDMLDSNRGRLTVQSELGQGTTVILTFPRSAAAKWIAQEMYLAVNQTIVILDDEQSIHDAWNMHFASLLTTYPKLRLHHFTQGNKALDFINGLSQPKKDNVILLSDYELLHQPRNGIEIIKASNIKRSLLVTSHYANPTVRDTATKLKIKILPKQMASVIPIHVE